MSGQLEGRAVLITGAGRGIGAAIARAVSNEGARVAVNDIDDDALHEISGAIADAGGEVLRVPADVTDRMAVDRMVTAAVGAYGRLDVLFSNAGIIELQDFMDVDEDHWDRVMNVNVRGVLFSGQAGARQMLQQGSGTIINTASIAGQLGVPDMAAYAASKAAVMSLTRTMSLALGPRGVTVNALAPGIVATDMWKVIDARRSEIRAQPPGSALEERVGTIPVGRYAVPDDIARVAVFLASDAASYLNGQTINIDGGILPT